MSRGTILHDTVELVTEECYKCATVFAFPLLLKQKCLADHSRSFFCPNGHEQHYIGKSEAEKERDRANREQQMREAAEARAAKSAMERDAVAKAHHKMRTRIANGVCPCCNRTFQNLLQHMKTEHPDFSEALSLKTLRTSFGMTQSQVAEEAGVSTTSVSNFERETLTGGIAYRRLKNWVDTHGA